MQTALHTLIQSAVVCQPIKADLRQSTLTLDWPANRLIQRMGYVLLHKADVDAALSNDAHLVIFPVSTEAGIVDLYRHSNDFSFTRGGLEVSCYFNRFPEGKYPKPPGTWWGHMSMRAADGSTWSRSLPSMVTNDFGDLVDLTTGERP